VRRRLTDVPYAGVVALFGVNSAYTFYNRPALSAVHQLVSPLDYMWSGMYGLGGLIIIVGIARARANIEAAGCVCLGGGALIAAIATAAVRGWSSWNTVSLSVLIAVASAIRTWHLASGRVLVLLDSPRVTDRRDRE
jgi:hypothetical protein